jgi:hypothetical protein
MDVLRGMTADSAHYSIFSPPFASLYTYSPSPRDFGNVASHAEFYESFRFVAEQLFRVLKPGRLLSFHCMLLPTSKQRDGHIGLTDFRGELIRIFQTAGFYFHSEVVIFKDPVTAMQRTKALGLLWKQIKKDSAMSRQGIPDYLITMRKPGENAEPVAHTGEGDDMPVELWQRYASPVWVTTRGVDPEGFAICVGDAEPGNDASSINPSDTLQYRSAREHADERHVCPLQLEVIRRAVKLWSNPGDVVLSPFMGIGSEGYVALEMGRRFVGAELKKSYFDQAVANLRSVVRDTGRQRSIFDLEGVA